MFLLIHGNESDERWNEKLSRTQIPFLLSQLTHSVASQLEECIVTNTQKSSKICAHFKELLDMNRQTTENLNYCLITKNLIKTFHKNLLIDKTRIFRHGKIVRMAKIQTPIFKFQWFLIVAANDTPSQRTVICVGGGRQLVLREQQRQWPLKSTLHFHSFYFPFFPTCLRIDILSLFTCPMLNRQYNSLFRYNHIQNLGGTKKTLNYLKA